ncbi:MAG: membrane dipeptidase [Gemmatimonadota bacterium]
MDRYIGRDAHASSSTLGVVTSKDKRVGSHVVETNARCLSRRSFLSLAGAAVLGPLASPASLRGAPGRSRGASGWPGYDEAIVIDALASPLQFNIPQGGLPLTEAVVRHIRASGITAVNLTAGVIGATAPDPFVGSVERIAEWEREMDRLPHVLRRIRRAEDLLEAKESGRLGVIYGFQDAVPLEGRLDRLALFHGLGVRVVQLTYNDRNRLGDGALEPGDGGLSRLGHAAVEEMERLGILVDLSHCGTRTTLEGIRAAAGPVAITHSGCNAVFPHPRNQDDQAMRLLAERGGVMGIYLMPFLNPSGPPATRDVVAHLEHALQVCGEDHVGIGTDQGIHPLRVDGAFQEEFDAVSARRRAMGIAAPREDTIPYVAELNHPRRMESIAQALADRGHRDRVIEKILGANWLRLFEEVWS